LDWTQNIWKKNLAKRQTCERGNQEKLKFWKHLSFPWEKKKISPIFFSEKFFFIFCRIFFPSFLQKILSNYFFLFLNKNFSLFEHSKKRDETVANLNWISSLVCFVSAKLWTQKVLLCFWIILNSTYFEKDSKFLEAFLVD